MSYRGTERRCHRMSDPLLHTDNGPRRSHAKLPTTVHGENMLLSLLLLLLLNLKSPSSLSAAVGGRGVMQRSACLPRFACTSRERARLQLRSASRVQRHRWIRRRLLLKHKAHGHNVASEFRSTWLISEMWGNDISGGDCVGNDDDAKWLWCFK